MTSPLLRMLSRAGAGVLSRWRNFYYRQMGVRIAGYAWLRDVEIPRAFHAIELADGVALDRGVILLASDDVDRIQIRIGPGTYVNRHTFIDAVDSISIGRDCAIGPNCYITDHDHGMDPSRPPLGQSMKSRPTTIHDRVWIGANVVVLKGVTIGESAIIGAGSVVTRDVASAAVVAGVPARTLESRG